MGDVKNIKTRVAWSLKKERASLVVENFKEAMDHLGSVDVLIGSISGKEPISFNRIL